MSSSTATWCTPGGGIGGNAWKAPALIPTGAAAACGIPVGMIAHRRSASSHREATAAAKASPCLLQSFSRSLALSSSRHARYAGSSFRSRILCAPFHSRRFSLIGTRTISGRWRRTRPRPPPPRAPHLDTSLSSTCLPRCPDFGEDPLFFLEHFMFRFSLEPSSKSRSVSHTSLDRQLRTTTSQERSHANVCTGIQPGRVLAERARAILILAPLTNSAKPISGFQAIPFSSMTNSTHSLSMTNSTHSLA